MAKEKASRVKKKALIEGYLLFYVDEASISISCYVARTFALRGKRPILEFNSEITRRLYVASAISCEGDLEYLVRDKPFDGEAIVEFLKQLLRVFANKKVMIIWDNASIHDCAVTRNFLQNNEDAVRLHLAKQPTYSPELNADEQVWSQIKCVGLKNSCYRNVKELKPKLVEEMEKLKANPEIIKQFFHHPDIGFYN